MFKKLLLSTSFLLASHVAFSQGVAINEDNSSANSSAILDIKSTTKGLLAPRMTETEKNAITSPATGLLIYQTNATAGFYYYNGTVWTFINAAGVSGLNSLSRTTTEAAGANCATGGIKVEYGLDINSNGTLDAGEENALLTKFVCNGAMGATGATGANGTNGTNGLNSLSRTTVEAAGANCATGGIKVEYGLDTNNNGTLDAGEENAPLTKFVCNGAAGATGATGANGTNGLNSLARTTVEAAGANCANGGIKVEYGLDTNNNAILDAGEINAIFTRYVCNGASGATGATGATGAAGQGVPTGGTTGQVLTKIDGTNYNTQWTTASGGGGGAPTLQLSATQASQTATNSVATTVTWTETSDPSNQFTSNVFTAASAGIYYINATFAHNFTGGTLLVIKKGSEIIAQANFATHVHTAGGNYATKGGNISNMIALAVNETITIEFVTNNATGSSTAIGTLYIYKF